MPVRKRPNRDCWYVVGTNTEKCLTKEEAEAQLRAIEASKQKRKRKK